MSHDPFRWIPGRGPDESARARIHRAFPKPAKPMGEAWFMGETRRTFDDFANRPLADISAGDFTGFLFEITSGISSFGDEGGEWSGWFCYCLADLIARSHEGSVLGTLFEATVSAFMNVYWRPALLDVYAKFSSDVVATLGHCLMKPELWIDGRTPRLGAILGAQGGCSDERYWGQTSGDFSAAMFFALRYFPVDALPGFIDSVVAIDDPAWRARLVTWLWGAAPLLRAPSPRSADLDRCRPPIDWSGSHCIGASEQKNDPLLADDRRELALLHFRRQLEPLLPTLSFAAVPALDSVIQSLGVVDALFDALY